MVLRKKAIFFSTVQNYSILYLAKTLMTKSHCLFFLSSKNSMCYTHMSMPVNSPKSTLAADSTQSLHYCFQTHGV